MEAGSRGVKERVQDEEMGAEGQNMRFEVRLQKEGDWRWPSRMGEPKPAASLGRTVLI